MLTPDGTGDTAKWTVALILILVLSASLSGCQSHYWASQVGVTEEQLKRDVYQCDQEVAAYHLNWKACMEAKGYSVGDSPSLAQEAAREAADRRSLTAKTPFERLTEARRQPTRDLLANIEAGGCPRLLACWLDYEATVRRLAANVSYTVTSSDELLFRAARDIVKASDDGTITQDQAVNRLLALDVQIDAIYRALQAERARQPR